MTSTPQDDTHHATNGVGVAEPLPWKIAFRVQFQGDKFGLRFHPAQYPDTGNGIYTIRVLELNKHTAGLCPAHQYNTQLTPAQAHLLLRPGLYLTHINDVHLLGLPCEAVIAMLQTATRPATLRFVDVEAGVVTPHELSDSLVIEDSHESARPPVSLPPPHSPSTATPERSVASPLTSPTSAPTYKLILLGTTGVGKSSVLAVSVSGDAAYTERRATTLEAEFGSFEVPNPDMTNPNPLKARIWDTAGQERYRAITRSHYRRADGALLVYDVAEPESFARLAEWLGALQDAAGDSLKSIMVLENKIDQLPPPDASGVIARPTGFVDPARVAAFCRSHGLLFARTTAKQNPRAFQWEGQRVRDAVGSLLLHVHATHMARGLRQSRVHGSASGSGPGGADGAVEPAASVAPRITLKESPPPRGESDCGSCGRGQ